MTSTVRAVSCPECYQNQGTDHRTACRFYRRDKMMDAYLAQTRRGHRPSRHAVWDGRQWADKGTKGTA